MRRRIRLFILACCALLVATACGWWGYTRWQLNEDGNPAAVGLATKSDEPSSPSDKIIVGDQAQKNLRLSAKPLETETFWKTITVQGMVVDRPGTSDREVVAPAIGTVSQLFHVPGDIVRPGDVLFTLKLASESFHQTQTELFKTNKNIQLATARQKRLAAAGTGVIPQATLIEVENEITRLEAAAKAYRQELLNRGLSPDEVDGVAEGKLLSEISLVVPPQTAPQRPLTSTLASTSSPHEQQPVVYELQDLKVGLGEQVQAGQTLCRLSNHQSLAIEGRAFRDETSLLERSIKEGWPIEVDFQEDAGADWLRWTPKTGRPDKV